MLWHNDVYKLKVLRSSEEQRRWKKGKLVPRTAADWQLKKKEKLTVWQMDTILLVFSVAFLPAGVCFLVLIYVLLKYFCSLLFKPYEESLNEDSISQQCKKKYEKSYSIDETVI